MSDWIETEYGLIPFGWEVLKADKYCHKVTDGTHDSPKQVANGLPLITSKHIKGREIDIENAYHISLDDYNKIIRRSKVDQWDVIVSMIGEYCGFCYIERNAIVEYAVKNVGIYKTLDEVKAKWLFYYLQSKTGRNVLEAQKTGTSQPYITLGSLRKLDIIAPKDPQISSAITEVLSSIDDKIDLLQRNSNTLESLGETFFKQMFIVEAQDSWEQTSFSTIANHVKVSINPAANPNQIYHHYSLPSYDHGKQPKHEFGSAILSNKYQVRSNQTLISKLNPGTSRVWYIHEAENISVCSTEFQVFEAKEDAFREYIYFFLKSSDVTDTLSSAASGTSGSHQRVSPDLITNLGLRRPDNLKVSAFSERTALLLAKINNNIKQIHQLESLRDTLLSKLMNGSVKLTEMAEA
ncbi:hypothetical protein GCM10028826_30220 [Mucilaginibacter boryungensis]